MSSTHPVVNSLRAKGFLEYVHGIVILTAMPLRIPQIIWEELLERKDDIVPKVDWEPPEFQDVMNAIDEMMAKNESRASW